MSRLLAFPPLHERERNQTLSLRENLIDERIYIEASVEEIWELLTRPEMIAQWQEGVDGVSLSHQESKSPVGTYREFQLSDGTRQRQVVTDWIAGNVLGYTTIENAAVNDVPLKLHIGLFTLCPDEKGTFIYWMNYVEPERAEKRQDWYKRVQRSLRRQLIYLKWRAEKSHNRLPEMV
jgi:uncharacterized protein YndB with AHSA1/START domain